MDEKDKETAEKFKRPLDLDQMIEYLRNTKRVTFINKSEDEAKEILYEHNYINVITPFKHRFAKKGEKGIILKDEKGRHIYGRDVDFSEYYNLYKAERDDYPKIFKNIMDFEHLLNSVVSYEVLNFYKLDDSEKYETFTNILSSNIEKANVKEGIKKGMRETVVKLREDIKYFKNPYIVFDNLYLNDIANILLNLNRKLRSKCINEMLKRQKIIRLDDPIEIRKYISRLIKIRNCVCHNDSIEILERYFSRRNNQDLRGETDRSHYRKLIRKLKNL